MDLESGYIISISRQDKVGSREYYQHFFRTDKILERRRAEDVFKSLCVCYPAPEYHITMTHWDIVGRDVVTTREDY